MVTDCDGCKYLYFDRDNGKCFCDEKCENYEKWDDGEYNVDGDE